jgi:hypothetical protein
MQTRRQFGKMVGTGALALGIGELTMGLSCSSIFSDIETYVPIGIEAFESIIAIITPAEATALSGIITIVKAAFADLAAAVTAYENAPAANKATLLGKITTAINAVMTAIQEFWSQANLPDGTLAATIEGVLQVILSTLAAFLPLVGSTMDTRYQERLQKLPHQITFTPAKRSQKQFKAAVNVVFSSHGYANRIY